MRLTIAAAVLSQALPSLALLSSGVKNDFVNYEPPPAKEASRGRAGAGGPRRIHPMKELTHGRKQKPGNFLRTISVASNRSHIEVSSFEECTPDVGILDFYQECTDPGMYCKSDDASNLGGFCTSLADESLPRSSGRNLQASFLPYIGYYYCDLYEGYYDCDCDDWDSKSYEGSLSCNFYEGYCVCPTVCYDSVTTYYTNDGNSWEYTYCYNFETPYTQVFCETARSDYSCDISLDGESCTSCRWGLDCGYFNCENIGLGKGNFCTSYLYIPIWQQCYVTPAPVPVSTNGPTISPTSLAPTPMPTTKAPTSAPPTYAPIIDPTLAPTPPVPTNAPGTLAPSFSEEPAPSPPPVALPTISPSASISPSMFDRILSIVSTISDLSVVLTTDSPQNMAYSWTKDDDAMNNVTDEEILQRYLMALFYYSTTGLDDTWLNNTTSECDWTGVTCSAGGAPIKFNMGNAGLAGSIMTEIGGLSTLMNIQLQGNDLTGSIPPGVGDLPSLTLLALQGNELSGSIPTETGKLGDLKYLRLSSNALTGAIPSQIGLLKSLLDFNVYSNALSGQIPDEMANLTALTSLNMGLNDLTGSVLPSWLGSFAPLEIMAVQGNSFNTSMIPTELGLLSNSLTKLVLANNAFTGPIPSELGELTLLTSLQLQGNLLEGAIPGEIGLLESLLELNVYSNALTGPFPDVIVNMTFLTDLNLGSNAFSGVLPTWLGDFELLESLALPGNRFNSTIPTELGMLFNTSVKLILSNNELTGTIPSELGALEILKQMRLDGNDLSGTIPPEVGNLVSMQILRMENNKLSGPIPSEIGEILPLVQLFLNNNGYLNGRIPSELGRLTDLQQMNLSANHLSGAIPSEIGDLSALSRLLVFENDLTGDVPNDLCLVEGIVIRVDCGEVNCTCCECS